MSERAKGKILSVLSSSALVVVFTLGEVVVSIQDLRRPLTRLRGS